MLCKGHLLSDLQGLFSSETMELGILGSHSLLPKAKKVKGTKHLSQSILVVENKKENESYISLESSI